jgi:hypothetical protein
MKGRLVGFVGILCIACLIGSGAYAKKPPKPPNPNPETECIVFTGDLESAGSTVVEGCCPNAGPSPAYDMTLNLTVLGIPLGTYEGGHLFTKPVSTRVNRQWTERYKVQFWTWDWATETPGDGDYFVQIYGDDIVEDENGVTVTFENDTATVWVYYDMNTDCDPCDPSCYPCNEVPPACDLCESDCHHPHGYCCLHPCNEEITIEDVSFVLTRTSDLTDCVVE